MKITATISLVATLLSSFTLSAYIGDMGSSLESLDNINIMADSNSNEINCLKPAIRSGCGFNKPVVPVKACGCRSAPVLGRPCHVPPVIRRPCHVPPVIRRPCHVPPVIRRPCHVPPVIRRPCHVPPVIRRPCHVPPIIRRPCHVPPIIRRPCHITATISLVATLLSSFTLSAYIGDMGSSLESLDNINIMADSNSNEINCLKPAIRSGCGFNKPVVPVKACGCRSAPVLGRPCHVPPVIRRPCHVPPVIRRPCHVPPVIRRPCHVPPIIRRPCHVPPIIRRPCHVPPIIRRPCHVPPVIRHHKYIAPVIHHRHHHIPRLCRPPIVYGGCNQAIVAPIVEPVVPPVITPVLPPVVEPVVPPVVEPVLPPVVEPVVPPVVEPVLPPVVEPVVLPVVEPVLPPVVEPVLPPVVEPVCGCLHRCRHRHTSALHFAGHTSALHFAGHIYALRFADHISALHFASRVPAYHQVHYLAISIKYQVSENTLLKSICLNETMSQDGTNIQDSASVSDWEMEILRRISHLEAQRNPIPEYSDASIDVDSDNYIVDKPPPRDLQLYLVLSNALPVISQDFFKSPITGSERRKFLGCCPRNTGMVYGPPSLNEMGISGEFKKEDSKL
ncbi:Repetitive proline-rich cell wall protein [Smittium culicis]|uniref:Repetitive proline-rich cell wall protein n=1 Tax=Smittium culicis TaxID=133412 RepID=A0A1R1Y9R8_9FUNG|nr:Repetitive proline-rich cell wall protein [Smittium culicis]